MNKIITIIMVVITVMLVVISIKDINTLNHGFLITGNWSVVHSINVVIDITLLVALIPLAGILESIK